MNQNQLKEQIESGLKTSPFLTAFRATMGFYLAQAVATFLGISAILGIILIIKLIF